MGDALEWALRKLGYGETRQRWLDNKKATPKDGPVANLDLFYPLPTSRPMRYPAYALFLAHIRHMPYFTHKRRQSAANINLTPQNRNVAGVFERTKQIGARAEAPAPNSANPYAIVNEPSA